MNVRTAATAVASATIPGAVIVGVTVAVSAVTSLQASRDHYAALAARPRPTATITQVAASPTPQPFTPSPTPSPRPSPQATDRTPGEPHQSGTGGTSGASGTGGGGAGPTPNPPTNPPNCSGRILAVRLQLGVLPDCAVTVGGSR